MNEQASKKILFNKSTLFSLKAELLKKQEEVKEKKKLPQHKLENFKPPLPKPNHDKKAEEPYKKSFKDSLKVVDVEELEACRKSQAILEKKAELYEHLSDAAGNSQLAERFLVDFNTKNKEEPAKEKPVLPTANDLPTPEIPGHYENDDDEWTEFTDCLGRTRKCLKTDLDMYKERDKTLMRSINRDQDSGIGDITTVEDSATQKEKPLLVQKTNDYLQSLREKWEQKERELLAKDKDIHYQDVLFDEARMHGVGYFSFSTDEAERRRQMEELMKTRAATLKAQQEAAIARKKREEMIAARVAATQARLRAMKGLPPEEPKKDEKDFTTYLLEFLTQQKNEADEKANEEERKRKEEEEKERQKLRDEYVREWDLGKEGVEEKLKKFREMTQEEYVEQQRDKRIDEFAPPQTSNTKNTLNTFDDKGQMIGSHVGQKTWADVRPIPKTPPPPSIGELTDFTQSKGLYFSSSKNKDTFKYRNFVRAQEPTPIIDELAIEPGPSERDGQRETKANTTGVEIAPPPTYDYYGPVPKQARIQKPFESDIREAYDQGTRSLENKSSNIKLSKNYDFTFD